MIDDDGWHDDGMMEELEKMLDLKPVEVHHDEAEEKHKELDPAEYDYESDGADGGPSDGVPPELEGDTLDFDSCIPAWGMDLLELEPGVPNFRWQHNGLAWEDAASPDRRRLGSSLWVRDTSIRVSCFCHPRKACGRLIYCDGVWDEVDKFLPWFFALGTRYPKKSLELERSHHKEILEAASVELAALRRRRLPAPP